MTGKRNSRRFENLSAFLDKQSEEELYESSELYQDYMSVVGKNESNALDFSEELGIRLPLACAQGDMSGLIHTGARRWVLPDGRGSSLVYALY